MDVDIVPAIHVTLPDVVEKLKLQVKNIKLVITDGDFFLRKPVTINLYLIIFRLSFIKKSIIFIYIT